METNAGGATRVDDYIFKTSADVSCRAVSFLIHPDTTSSALHNREICAVITSADMYIQEKTRR